MADERYVVMTVAGSRTTVKSYKEDIKQVLRISFYCAGIGAVVAPLGVAIAWQFSGTVGSQWYMYLPAALIFGGLGGFPVGLIFGLIYKLYTFAFKMGEN